MGATIMPAAPKLPAAYPQEQVPDHPPGTEPSPIDPRGRTPFCSGYGAVSASAGDSAASLNIPGTPQKDTPDLSAGAPSATVPTAHRSFGGSVAVRCLWEGLPEGPGEAHLVWDDVYEALDGPMLGGASE